jgi:dTMP kinase
MRPGVVISFEGISCAGKSTAVHKIQHALKERDIPVAVKSDLFEYRGVDVGAQIKAILNSSAPKFRLGLPVVETLLICAKRAFEAQQRLEPAIGRGNVILCDRDIDTVCAYQLEVLSEYRPLKNATLIDWIRRVNQLAAPEPDLTFYLDVTAEESLRRDQARPQPESAETSDEIIAERRRHLEMYDLVLSEPLPGRSLYRIKTESRTIEAVYGDVLTNVESLLQLRGFKV